MNLPFLIDSIFLPACAGALVFLFLPQLPAAIADEPLKGNVQHTSIDGITEGRADIFNNPLSGELTGGLVDEFGQVRMPAGLSFDKTVPPVEKDLKLHKLFSSVTLPAEDKEDSWYQIPRWRAGEFHRETQVSHTRGGDVETTSRVDHVYGMQVDKEGGIWHHMSWPRITKLSLDGYSQYKIINRYEPVKMNQTEYCVKIYSTNIDVDDKSGKIIRLAKQEEFDRYFPAGKGIARGDCIIQGFSHYGRPNTEIECCSVEEKLAKPFNVINSFRGKDLRQSFRNYLQSHELSKLLPD